MPDTATAGPLSFTFSDDGRVLALARMPEDGDFLTRKDGQWEQVDGEDDDIYDRDIIDISPDHYDNATAKFDANPTGLTKGDIATLLTSV